jgi:hypothetical protein
MELDAAAAHGARRVPLGEDLLSSLGEYLREAREHLLRGLGQRTLGAGRTGLARRGTEAQRGMVAAARRSGLAWSTPDCCASKAVARRAWLG